MVNGLHLYRAFLPYWTNHFAVLALIEPLTHGWQQPPSPDSSLQRDISYSYLGRKMCLQVWFVTTWVIYGDAILYSVMGSKISSASFCRNFPVWKFGISACLKISVASNKQESGLQGFTLLKEISACLPSAFLSSCGLWPSPTEFTDRGGKLGGDSWCMAVDGEPAEKWQSYVWWDSGGRGLCVEQRQLLLRVSHLERCHGGPNARVFNVWAISEQKEMFFKHFLQKEL